MVPEADPFGKLSESIADGESLDWDALRAAAPDDGVRRLLDHLRIVAGVAEVHRAQVAETVAATVSTPLETASPRAPDTPPLRWGHLLLVRKIGEGAYGEVFEALDTWLDHPRALKLLKPEVANRSSAPQILHEARKLVRVRHPNVVMVHGADSHDGRVGFWMDLIEGQTLEERVRDGRLSPGEAAYVGQELCRALAAVHQANLLHRDIKAQNVMRASDGGRIILMDFGAGEFRDAQTESRPHGTPLYLAPELLTGAAATIQSDVYALGVLLYYLVSGRFPVEGSTFTELVLAHAQQRRQHLRDVRSDLPDGYVNVVERAIDPNPERRFRSAGEFHAALEKGARSKTETDNDIKPRRDVPPASEPAPAARSYPSLANIAIGTFGLLLVILLLGIVACRAFEVALHVPPGFTAGLGKYAEVGTSILLAFAGLWILGGSGVALLIWLQLLFRPVADRLTNPIRSRVAAVSATTLATLVAVLGVLWWVAITWWHAAIFSTLFALQSGSAIDPGMVSLVSPVYRAISRSYVLHSATLCFVLLFIVWRWWPRLERRADDAGLVRTMRWAPIAIALLAVVSASAPRRFVWERFQVVLYKNQPTFVIGSNGDEWLLYASDPVGTAPRRVRKDSTDISPADNDRPRFIVPD